MSYWMDETKPFTRNWVQHRHVGHGDDEYAIRNRQVRHRADEVSRALDLMRRLNDGAGKDGGVPNMCDLNRTFDLADFAGLIDLSSPAVCGHSFGGATTCMALASDDRFKLGIALDAWMFPIKEEPIGAGVKQPLYFLSADSFRCEGNLGKKAEFAHSPDAAEDAPERRFEYIRGSVHQNTLDLPFIMQYAVVKKVVGLLSETCPETVIELNNKLMLQFLWKHTGRESDADVDGSVAKLNHYVEPLKFPSS